MFLPGMNDSYCSKNKIYDTENISRRGYRNLERKAVVYQIVRLSMM